MQLEQPAERSAHSNWNGTVPGGVDAKVVATVVVAAGLAASLNLPYGGPLAAAAAFALLTSGGVVVHLLGERRLRRVTDGLVEQWVDAGGRVEDVTRTSGLRTEWTVHTAAGDVTVGGFAMAPISRLSITRDGIGEAMAAADAERHLEQLASEWYRELFGGRTR
ncbi:hypothetical protein [Natrononativus amylolyticus]|uniref:hypothetical protein n=1 Tax=Natrononativus amylolyticus TaxID=2963434 RepID=UPI0020CD7FAE|nr:hypothetical protein [Natrononativus amylolyticus]